MIGRRWINKIKTWEVICFVWPENLRDFLRYDGGGDDGDDDDGDDDDDDDGDDDDDDDDGGDAIYIYRWFQDLPRFH